MEGRFVKNTTVFIRGIITEDTKHYIIFTRPQLHAKMPDTWLRRTDFYHTLKYQPKLQENLTKKKKILSFFFPLFSSYLFQWFIHSGTQFHKSLLFPTLHINFCFFSNITGQNSKTTHVASHLAAAFESRKENI